jgi:hypothetical protein
MALTLRNELLVKDVRTSGLASSGDRLIGFRSNGLRAASASAHLRRMTLTERRMLPLVPGCGGVKRWKNNDLAAIAAAISTTAA